MPKGKKKGKYEHRRTEQMIDSDEDAGIDMTTDNFSETSGTSDMKSNHDDTENEQEKLEEKVLEIIEALGGRSSGGRATTFGALQAALQRRELSAVLRGHRATLAEHVSRALRRGKDAERRAAAAVAPLLALQIGEEGDEEFVSEVRPALSQVATDKSASLDTRTECCSSLAILCYLFEEDLMEILEVMRMYETIFSGSYLKGDGSVKVAGAAVEEGALHASALEGWALLLVQLPASHAAGLLAAHEPSPRRLTQLLEAAAVEVRLAGGGALALLAEHLALRPDALEPTALPTLQALATDSHKFRAKRDRKLQRATFRDILKYIEDGEFTATRVQMGAESVSLDTWAGAAAYSAAAAALGGGLPRLLPLRPRLRLALGLQPAAPLLLPGNKPNKLQRHLANSAACKARTVARNKSRDKRSAALAL